MPGSILYCGDTSLGSAASYLAGLITSWGWEFDYLPSDVAITSQHLTAPRSLLILSDYPAARFTHETESLALDAINKGCGLLMIGGWESFHGFGGDWDGTAIGNVLPVSIQSTDDRQNFDQSAWLLPTSNHPITNNLPWQTRPPAIGGMNRVQPKADAKVLLNAHAFQVTTTAGKAPATAFSFTHQETLPALVVGQHGAGRTAVFLSDVAPHWVGGFVDWGLPRVTAEAKGGGGIEVGHDYAQFWKQLLQWTAAMPV